MRKVLIYSILLIAGLVCSQILTHVPAGVSTGITLLTMVALSFIMIHVGYEFEIDKSRPRQYAWDAVVASTAASLPWLFCALYFIFVMSPRGLWDHPDLWRGAFLKGLFAAPTSAGVLFSMLAAAGLGATWLFQKARVLAIFDDLGTILLLIPLKIMMSGLNWQLFVTVAVILALLWVSWQYLHRVSLPVSWPFVLIYSAVIALLSEGIYLASKLIDESTPIHLEVLLPAFALGCILARPKGTDPHSNDAREGHEQGPESSNEQLISTIVSACFMVLVGLSMPPIRAEAGVVNQSALSYAGASAELLAAKDQFPGWGIIALHVLAVTLISNIGKMFPALCYRKEVSFKERIALSIGMFPRGEVGAGVLVISLSYGLAGPTLTVAVVSLALNLLLTGVFIVGVKRLISKGEKA